MNYKERGVETRIAWMVNAVKRTFISFDRRSKWAFPDNGEEEERGRERNESVRTRRKNARERKEEEERLVFLPPPQLPTVIVRSTFLRGTVSIDRIDDAETFFPVRGYATMRRLPVVRRTIRILSKWCTSERFTKRESADEHAVRDNPRRPDNEQRLEISDRTGRGKLKGYCNLSIVSAPCIVQH